jgi:hypothetical protein
MNTKADNVSAETQLFRQFLTEQKVGGASSYEWHDGEPLYRGDPIAGRISPEEFAAVKRMLIELGEWKKDAAT